MPINQEISIGGKFSTLKSLIISNWKKRLTGRTAVAGQWTLVLTLCSMSMSAAAAEQNEPTPVLNALPSPFSIDRNEDTSSNSPAEKLANGITVMGSLATADDSGKAAAGMARSAVLGEANASLERWLSQYGTARVQLNFDEKMKVAESSLDTLLPFYDDQDILLFTQLGIRQKDSRNTVNIGVGGRYAHNGWIYGTNAFYDYDMTGKNRRLGIGTEAWRNYLKLSANGYFGLTRWHQSLDFADYNERPANGFDLRAEAYLPLYPPLGGKMIFEKYYGNEVALFGKDNRRKDPFAVTAGLNYTPIPLVTLGTEYRRGEGHNGHVVFGLELNYRLGELWRSQLDPSAVADSRTLASSRYDLVARNNNIVLDYQKQALISLVLPERVSGNAGDSVTVMAKVTAKNGLGKIEWDKSGLQSAGAIVTRVSPNSLGIQLPPYRPNDAGGNSYTLAAIAYDAKGNSSNRAATQIVVDGQVSNERHSQTSATPDVLPADGVSASEILLYLKDDDNQPISGMRDQLIFSLDFKPAEGREGNEANAPQVRLSDIKELSAGVYGATLTVGVEIGNVVITPFLEETALDSVAVKLISGGLAETSSAFTVEPREIIADGAGKSLLTLIAKDAQDRPMKDMDVTFAVTGLEEGFTLSEVTGNEGVYTAWLSGTKSGAVEVIPQVDGIPLGSLSGTITLHPQEIILTTTVNVEKRKVGEIIDLNVTARYRHSNALAADVDITFATASVVDRQNITRADSGVLLLDGKTADAYRGKTAKNGTLRVSVSDPNGIGVKTGLTPLAEGNPGGTAQVIFTVLTSPDTSRAQMYGHMSDQPITGNNGTSFRRPHLAREAGSEASGSVSINNEQWALFNASEMYDYCGPRDGSGLPTSGDYLRLADKYGSSIIPTYGWPAGTYRSSTSFGNNSGKYGFNMVTASITSPASDSALLLSCKNK